MDLQESADEVVAITRQHLTKVYEHTRPALRCQHAKGFGIKGKLLTRDVAKGYRHGVFESLGSYPITVRFSNNSPEVQDDKVPAARGLAIKVFELADGEGGERTWDLLLASGRGFFAKDAEDCVPLAERMAEGHMDRYFFPDRLKPRTWRLRGFAQAWKATHSGIVDPLDGDYDSFLPFAMGPHVVRYIVQPLHPTGVRHKASSGPDHLREAVALRLAVESVSLGLFVQLGRRDGRLSDPRALRSRVVHRPVLMGSLEFGLQQLMDDREVEALVFNPGNAPGEHKPLGEINAVRVAAYEASAEFRRKANGEL